MNHKPLDLKSVVPRDPSAFEREAAIDVEALLADNARLRALVKAAEWEGCHCRMDVEPNGCPWCNGDTYGSRDLPKRTHADDCPAFTADGVVR